MLGGSPRGGDGTNVVLNEFCARRLGGVYRKAISACGRSRINRLYGTASQKNSRFFWHGRHGFIGGGLACFETSRAVFFCVCVHARECAYACVSAREAERVVREASGVCLRSIALGGEFAGGDCSGSTEVRWVEGRSSTYAHTSSALEPPSTHRLPA